MTQPTATTSQNPFSALGLSPALADTLAALGYEEPTPIQREAIPPLIEGRDLLGQAATGTGKTAAFALPLLSMLPEDEPKPGRPRALVLVPTRELAMQVAQAIHRYGKDRGASVLPIYGGQSIFQQLRVLQRGVEVAVATPGRALDHLERGTLVLDDVRMIVLDEADEMLDMGFSDDLEAILGRAPAVRQTALFSATMAPRILAIGKRHLKNPVQISIEREMTKAGEVPRVRQVAYVVQRAHKLAALGRVLDMETPTSAIVFCRTRLNVDEVMEAMNARGYRAEALHGGFAQEMRDRVMGRFRDNKTDLLIATDVAARGLDIEHVSHVVNFDVPTEPDAYVHRIGRTGRAGREGVAITFFEPRERRLLTHIQRATQLKISIETIPTVADLRTKQLELTRASLLETALAGELDAFRGVVEGLSAEIELLDLAAAAVKLAHEASHAQEGSHPDDQDISIEPPPQRYEGNQGRQRPTFGRERFDPRSKGPRGDGPRGEAPRKQLGFDTVRIFIGAGRSHSMRPGDLVGAITGETGLAGSVIGAIEIGDRFALVDVAAQHADQILRALRGTKIRGKSVPVRFDRHAPR